MAAGCAAWHLFEKGGNPWDFRTFYYAASASAQGLDPYRLESLNVVAGRSVLLPFLYSPATLAIFAPFTWLPIHVASQVWLGIKLALTVGLFAVWRPLVPRIGLASLLAVGLFGFNAALLLDLTTGNVSVLEQLLLWLGFRHYVEDRRGRFAAFVVAASIFKLAPIVFLGLLLVPSERRGRDLRLVAISVAAWAAIVFLPMALGIGPARGFFSNLPVHRPAGEMSPSLLGLFDLWIESDRPRDQPSGTLPVVCWGLAVAGMLAVSRGALWRAWQRRDPSTWVMLAALLFALLSPRMMLYSYVILVIPALYWIERAVPSRTRPLLVLALVVQGVVRILAPRWYVPAVSELSLSNYTWVVSLPYLLTLGLWIGYLIRLPRKLTFEERPIPTPAAAPARRAGPARDRR